MVFELDFLDRILPDENLILDSSIKSNLKVTPKGEINSSNVEDFIISDLEGKVYKHGDKCYKYSTETDRCDSTKRQIDLMDNSPENE